jgi:hypothetical protein
MRKGFYAALVLSLSACGGRHPLQPGSGRAGDAAASDVQLASYGDAATDTGLDTRHCTFMGFAPAVSYPTTHEPMSILAVDRTGNGHLDLVVSERGDNKATSEFLANAGNGTFALSASYGVSSNNLGSLVAADFNGDGKIDLASQVDSFYGIDVGTGNGVLAIDFGAGNGPFASQVVTYSSPQSYGYLTVGDFNGDGHPDLAFAGYDYVMAGGYITPDGLIALPAPEPTDFALNVFFNAGDGTLAAPVIYANPNGFEDIASGDFDGDGHLDIAELSTSGSAGGIGVFFNAGDGTLRSEVTYVASPDWIAYGLAVADFNGDGKDDVATTTILNPNAASEATVLQVFTGASNGSLNGPVSYPIANIPSVYQIVTGDFNGDGKPDLAMVIGHTSQGALVDPVPVAVFENLGDGTFGAPVTYGVAGGAMDYGTSIAAGDFNGDGVTDIAVTTSSEDPPYPVAVNVLLSKCE